MNWGRYINNLVKIKGFIFWYFDSISCIPTTNGLKLAKETFTNSEYNIELAGNFLPVIKVNITIPEDWARILNLKTKFSIDELLIILEKISLSLKTNGCIEKENEKRIGLIYIELISRLNNDFDNTIETIKKWVVINQMISTSKKNIHPKDLLYINILGFENSTNGIETILIPKNVDTTANFFEELLTTFGVKIINNFSYQAQDQKEFYDIKIKLLKLVGPICLILKNKIIINDLDRSLYERFLKISRIDFIHCNNIRPVFVYESEDIEGKAVMYYYDENNNKFLISESWKNPSVILNISYHLSKILTAVKLEKEIMMMLNMSDQQIINYLTSLEINYEEYKSSKIASEISSLVKELENKSIITDTKIDTYTVNQDGSKNSIEQENIVSEPPTSEYEIPAEDKFLKEVEEFISDELDGTEWSGYITELRMLLQLDNGLGEQKKKIYNLLAKLKLAKNRNIKFEQVNENDRQFNFLEGNGEKYIVHSARSSFAYISPIEILKMKNDGYKMALDFGNKKNIKIYEKAEDILSLNTNHLLLYQYDKTMDELFEFCESNQNANKKLLIIDKENASNKSKELLKLMIPDDEF